MKIPGTARLFFGMMFMVLNVYLVEIQMGVPLTIWAWIPPFLAIISGWMALYSFIINNVNNPTPFYKIPSPGDFDPPKP